MSSDHKPILSCYQIRSEHVIRLDKCDLIYELIHTECVQLIKVPRIVLSATQFNSVSVDVCVSHVSK